MVLAGAARIGAAFSQQEVGECLDFCVGDGSADDAAAFAVLFDQLGCGQQFQVMGQGRPCDASARAKFTHAKPVGARAHQTAQHGQTLFRSKGGKDGGRLWPSKFKREMGNKLRSGELTVVEVTRACKTSQSKVSQWKNKAKRGVSQHSPTVKVPHKQFAEIKVVDDEPLNIQTSGDIIFKRKRFELTLPTSYPIEQLVQLVRAIDNSQ